MGDADDNDGFVGFLQQLVEGGHLENAALGITKKVIADGHSGKLSPKQLHAFNKFALGEHTVLECKRCGNEIPWSEMYDALEHGMCSWCWRMSKKDD